MCKAVFRLGLVVLAVMGLLATNESSAGVACSGFQVSPNAYDFESITVSTTSIGFTAAKITPSGTLPAVYANCTLETNPIRHREDGLAPSATVGQLVTAGQSIDVCGVPNIQTVRFIRQGAADGTLQCHYYRFQ